MNVSSAGRKADWISILEQVFHASAMILYIHLWLKWEKFLSQSEAVIHYAVPYSSIYLLPQYSYSFLEYYILDAANRNARSEKEST